MKYSGIIKNDFTAGPGVSLSFFVQGCPHHCFHCQNPETWSFEGGKEFTYDILNEIIKDLTANNIKRNFAIMGGEPLCEDNEFLTHLVISTVKEKLPKTPIYIWTGYTYEELLKRGGHIPHILELTNVLIDGPYMDALRDLTLEMRGSSNQKIYYLHPIDK